MIAEAEAYGLPEPELIDLNSDFRVNLYRKKMSYDRHGVVDPRFVAEKKAVYATDCATNATDCETKLKDTEQKLLAALREKNTLTQKELHEITGISLGTIKRLLPKLQTKGRLERIGNRRNGMWKVKE